KRTFDVLIIGAGIAGLPSAIALGGHRVILSEDSRNRRCDPPTTKLYRIIAADGHKSGTLWWIPP
ncbi:hypothetical protein N7450_010295, partial [Penicillium hetheringtonii]